MTYTYRKIQLAAGLPDLDPFGSAIMTRLLVLTLVGCVVGVTAQFGGMGKPPKKTFEPMKKDLSYIGYDHGVS